MAILLSTVPCTLYPAETKAGFLKPQNTHLRHGRQPTSTLQALNIDGRNHTIARHRKEKKTVEGNILQHHKPTARPTKVDSNCGNSLAIRPPTGLFSVKTIYISVDTLTAQDHIDRNAYLYPGQTCHKDRRVDDECCHRTVRSHTKQNHWFRVTLFPQPTELVVACHSAW